jgi:hypothetical protein
VVDVGTRCGVGGSARPRRGAGLWPGQSTASTAWRDLACELACGHYCCVAFGCALLCCSSLAVMWVLLACMSTRCMLMYEIKRKMTQVASLFMHESTCERKD